MIQRKQTIFLILAIICFMVNACLPIGYLIPEGMGIPSTINCIGIVDGNTQELSTPFAALPIIMLALNIAEAVLTIFSYKNRKSQALQCNVQIVGIIVQYICCGVSIWLACVKDTEYTYGMAYSIFLPVLAIVFILLARKGIMDDERLIRSIDRIR